MRLVIESVGLHLLPFESNGKTMQFCPSSTKLKSQKEAPKLYSRLIQLAEKCKIARAHVPQIDIRLNHVQQVDHEEDEDIKNNVLQDYIKDLQLVLLAFLVEHSEVNPELVVSPDVCLGDQVSKNCNCYWNFMVQY